MRLVWGKKSFKIRGRKLAPPLTSPHARGKWAPGNNHTCPFSPSISLDSSAEAGGVGGGSAVWGEDAFELEANNWEGCWALNQ